jgi:hypothetical protein
VVVLLILVLSCLNFRGLGFPGISAFATWQACARDGLSLMQMQHLQIRSRKKQIQPSNWQYLSRIFGDWTMFFSCL